MARAKSTKPAKGFEWKTIHFVLLIFALSFVYYGSTVPNGYSMDDDLVTSTSPGTHKRVEKGIAGIPEIFRTRYVQTKKQSYAYRPVTTSSFALEYQFFGANPNVSHFLNVLLYGLLIVMIFLLIRELAPRSGIWLAGTVALVFLIHPIHSEVVNNIKCRDELLMALFGVLSLRHSVKYVDNRKWINLLWAVLFFALSVFSKRTALVFVPLIPLTLFFFRDLKLKFIAFFLGGMVVMFAVVKFISKALVNNVDVVRTKHFFENPLFYSDSFADNIPAFFYTNGYYLKLMFAPFPLRYYYGFDQVTIATWSHWLVIPMMLLMGVGLFFLLKRFKKKEIWAFGIWFYLLGIGGACNLLFPAMGIVAERFTFLASVGFAITMGYLIFKGWNYTGSKSWIKPLTRFGSALILIITLVQVNARNMDWESRISIYEADMPKLQRSAKAHSLLAQEYGSIARQKQVEIQQAQSQGRAPMRKDVDELNSKVDSAIRHFEMAIEIYSDYPIYYNNLGAMYYMYKGDHRASRENFAKAVELDSNYTEGNFNLGNSYYWDWELNGSAEKMMRLNLDSVPGTNKDFETFVRQEESFLTGAARLRKQLTSTVARDVRGAQDINQLVTTTQNRVVAIANANGLGNVLTADWFIGTITNQQVAGVDAYNNGRFPQFVDDLVFAELGRQLATRARAKGYSTIGLHRYLQGQYEEFGNEIETQYLRSIETDSLYYPAYKKLTEFYMNSGKLNKVVEINQRGADANVLEFDQEWYINIANVKLKQNLPAEALAWFQNAADQCVRNLQWIDEQQKDQPEYKQQFDQQARALNQKLNSIRTTIQGLQARMQRDNQ